MVPYRQDIDGLRAVAVSVIVLYHFGVSSLAGGYVGVDVFFVISGFLIAKLVCADVETGQFSYRDFYMRRLRRLGPSLLAVLGLTLLAGYFILSPSHYEQLGFSTLAALLSVPNILFWSQAGYFDTDAIFKPLLHTWSLAVEEQFYLVWPTVLLLFGRIAVLRHRLALLFGLSVASFLAAELMLGHDPAGAFFLPVFRVYEFSFGAALAMTGRSARPGAMAHAASFIGFALIAFACLYYSEEMRFPGASALVPCVGAALVIFAGPGGLVNRVLSVSPIRYIGRISYSLYLVHWPLVVFFAYFFGTPNTLGEVLLLSAVAVVMAAILYHFVETPFRDRAADGFRISNAALGASALVAACVIVLSSVSVYRQEGFPSRVATEIRSLLDGIEKAEKAREAAIRKTTCHFTDSTSELLSAEFSSCLPMDLEDAIVVLGDSHAADVWVGLSKIYPGRNFVQLTGAGCNFARVTRQGHHCTVLAQVAGKWMAAHAEKFSAVIYSQRAASVLDGDPARDTSVLHLDIKKLEILERNLEEISSFGAPVIFWGPRPEFHPAPQVVASRSLTVGSVGVHYRNADISAYERLDDDLADHFAGGPVTYISSIDPLCDPSCPILLDNGAPAISDYAHWSPQGAAFAVYRIISGSAVLRQLLQANLS